MDQICKSQIHKNSILMVIEIVLTERKIKSCTFKLRQSENKKAMKAIEVEKFDFLNFGRKGIEEAERRELDLSVSYK